ncbi:APC membrane recruitment protein 1 [Ascaphus truei]|uniref:APC membrane recruitment protein 1 n=1 Tax=Ascaphus truei TaxID=8439 RepID=UPI003F5A5545
METDRSCPEENIVTKSSSATCKKKSGDLCPAGDSGKAEPSPGSCPDQQTPGKQKKTPFKFFGGRKSICALPSFFGGKHRGLGKGSSRKGLSKSKTHDGISDAHCEDGRRGCSDYTVNKARGQKFTKGANTLPSSHSADLGITSPVKLDFNFHDTSPLGSTECFDKKLNGEKSLSFPRPKKGLKGLFSSIRRHKKSKTPEAGKSERCDHAAAPCAILEQANHKPPAEEAQQQDCSEQPTPGHLLPGISGGSMSREAEREKEESLGCCVSLSEVAPRSINEVPLETDKVVVAAVNRNHALEAKTDGAIVCSSPDGVIPDIVNPDYIDRDPPSLPAGDQVSLIFDDVSSLKSFDSFTGCGDIIAEPDIDSISDATISLERSRETTKRSSCLVTYQGGGEEMATPDDMEEEYLQQLLDNATDADASYELKDVEEHKVQAGLAQLEHTACPMEVKEPYVDESGMSNTELLTPQSDQQESAPNSDEGYYDSTTPGPEDDTGEGFTRKERLPRDSYSGDALYEFYEPDDSLMSPAPGGESLYETKTLCSELLDQFFDFSLPADDSFIQDVGAMETEEERLAVIQKQLLFWERQREAALKGMEHLNKGRYSKEKRNVECENRASSLMGRNKGHLSSDPALLKNASKAGVKNGVLHPLTEKQSWKDFQEASLANTRYLGRFIQHLEGNGLIRDAGFELNVDGLGTQDHDDPRKENTVMFSNTEITPGRHCQNVFDDASSPDYGQKIECEQAVNFSQTLVEFTNNGTLFSSISERLGRTGSRSSFHHNLDVLPTMVTFDIVDVENEGECEQQIEFNAEEEVAASFEAFDHSYMQESLADCEEQLFHLDSQQPFHSYKWGVASLPRHLSHYNPSLSMPAPLSLNRRSKSLDTESLELELGGLHLSKSGQKSYDLLSPLAAGKNSWCYEDACPLGDDLGCDILEQDIQTSGRWARYKPVISSKQGYSRESKGLGSSNQLPKDSRQMARTSNAPLQCNTSQSLETSTPYQYNGENTTKKRALVLPLEERRGVSVHHSSSFPHSSDKQVKTKPVGITQAMPQQHKNTEDSLKPSADDQEQSEGSKKGTVEHGNTAAESWTNNYRECTSS